MSTLTIRLSSEQYEKLKVSAEQRNMSVGKLMDKLSTIILDNYETHRRFELMPPHGCAQSAFEEFIEKFDR